ncbi:MAG: sulfotransferase family protein [Chloroflexi bacterium]|nr:sulfotransferase family protein [Chloroflexota bacterium]
MLVFVTAVKHPDNSKSYEEVWRLLNNTLYSVCSQTDTDFRVVVVCDKKMPLIHNAILINKYTDFIEVDFPSHSDEVVESFNRLGNLSPPIENPKWWRQWSRDRKKTIRNKGGKLFRLARKKLNLDPQNQASYTYMSNPEIKLMVNYALNRGSKQLIGFLAAKKHTPEYVLIFDADDYVGNDIAAYVNSHPGENGWIMTHGYKLSGDLVAPFYNKTSFCGTGNIVSYSLLSEDIPSCLSEKSSQDELFRYVDSKFLITLARHGKVRAYYRKKDRDFLNYPSRSAIHVVGHYESNEFLRRKLRKEADSLQFEEAQKYAVFSPITQEVIDYFNILSIPEIKTDTESQPAPLSVEKKAPIKLLLPPLLRTKKDGKKVNKLVKFSSELTYANLGYQKISSHIAKTVFYPSDTQYNLTVSEEKKFIWFRVGKVGSRTILDLFRQADIELAAEHPFDVHYPINSYQKYFKFAFVRNPWDRLVSCWRDKVIKRDKFNFSDSEQEFESFVDYIAKYVDLAYGNPHIRLQSKLIDLNHIDFLGRFEAFEEDIKEVMRILDIEASIKKKNASKRKADYRDYYTDRIKDKVAELYKQDIQIFNYKF